MAGEASNPHVVVVPYPGRGHINPMLNLCRLILQFRPQTLISFILTEEWLGLLAAASPPPTPNLSFHTIPNVIPSEIGRAKDFAGFYEAVITKLEAPVERLLDRLPPASVIVYDTYLTWAVAVGNRRNVPLASFYTMSATVFSIFHHFHLIQERRRLPSDITDEGEEDKLIDYIPGVPPMRITDLPTPLQGKGHEVLPRALQAIQLVSKAQYLLFTSIYELESQVLDSLRQELPLKIYSLGLAIPSITAADNDKPHYLEWLDSQPRDSVLYISQGSFLSVSKAQLEEISIGIRTSGVRFLWVGRGDGVVESSVGRGLVVPWCDQLRVLTHPSVGAFWSHCGWNSTKEGAFAGLPMLTFPIFWDQVTNSKMIVEDWGIGERVMKEDGSLVRGDEIAEVVVRVMGTAGPEAEERRRRAKEMKMVCESASGVGGSSHGDVMAFIRDICGE